MGEVFMMGGIGNMDVSDATATTDKVLSGETFYSNENEGDSALVGTMLNNGLLNPESLNAGESFTIPEGYTSGGIVTAKDLASQTSATATASSILIGETAWANGEKVIGTISNSEIKNNGTATTSDSFTLGLGASATISSGYVESTKTISAPTLSLDSGKSIATAASMLSGYQAFNTSGAKISGSMVQRSASNKTLSYGGSQSYSAGYYPSEWTVTGGTTTRGARGNFIFTGGSKNTNSSGYGDFSITISFGFTPTYLAITFPQINGGSSVFNIFNMTVSNMGTAYSQETNGLKAQLVNVTSNGCTLRIYGFNENQVHASSGTAYYVAC